MSLFSLSLSLFRWVYLHFGITFLSLQRSHFCLLLSISPSLSLLILRFIWAVSLAGVSQQPLLKLCSGSLYLFLYVFLSAAAVSTRLGLRQALSRRSRRVSHERGTQSSKDVAAHAKLTLNKKKRQRRRRRRGVSIRAKLKSLFCRAEGARAVQSVSEVKCAKPRGESKSTRRTICVGQLARHDATPDCLGSSASQEEERRAKKRKCLLSVCKWTSKIA